MVEKSISPALARCFWLGAFGMLVGLVLLTVHFRRSRKNEDDDVVDDAGQPDTDTDSNLSTSTTDFITTTTTDPTTASLSSMPHPHSSGDRSHDTIRQVTGHVTRQVTGQATASGDDLATASGDDLTTTMAALSSGGILSRKHAELLVSLLSTDDSALLQRVLVTVANAAAFTSNQNTLRDAGCLSHLSRLLHTHLLCVTVGQNMTHPTLVNGVVKAIGNLAANEDNQAKIQDCIPTLIQLTSSEKSSEDLQLASLQALTNLSVTSTYHPPYTKVIQQLYELLDVVANPAVRLQSLKVLVNLSCNADMVPHLLAAKAPCCLIDLLHSDCDEDLLLRWLTILANISSTSRQFNITYVTLPTQYKAASPETMYTALYGLNNSAKLKSKVFVLSRHGNESVRCQATRIYSVLL